MQSWINAQRRYCAGPRLDCARDASLDTNKITARHINKGKAHSGIFFSLFFFALFFFAMLFFCALFFFALLFFLRKITIMASVSKLFPGQTDRMGTNFLWQKKILTARTQKLETGQKKLPIMAPVWKHSETPKNRIARIFFEKCVFEKFWA